MICLVTQGVQDVKRYLSSITLPGLGLVLALLLTGCGGGANPTQVPTFTPIPTYRFETPTPLPATPISAATATTAGETALDPALVETGKGRYEAEALACAGCHGADGKGTDKGSDLTISKQTEDEFITFMRSGGTLAPEHQYSTNLLSTNGGRALYQYLLSLRQ